MFRLAQCGCIAVGINFFKKMYFVNFQSLKFKGNGIILKITEILPLRWTQTTLTLSKKQSKGLAQDLCQTYVQII